MVEPLLSELLHGWVLHELFGYDAKPVVHISFQEKLEVVVVIPHLVRFLPLEFSGDDGYAA